MNNIIIVKLDFTYATVYSGIWQWNYGQILRIQGGNLPKAVEVHFSLQDKGGDSITRIGTTIDGATDVPIPDSFLENGGCAQDYKIYAFIYLEDGTAGNTEYKIEMSVKSRPKPEVPGTPEEPELFRETVKAVNAAADRAEQSEQKAKASEVEAGKYAAGASESAVAAEKTKEDALREVGEKKQEAIEAIQKQEEASAGKIINHTDNEIQRIQNQVTESETELEQTIKDASIGKTALDGSINAAGESKDDLDKSIKSATTAKTELDTSTEGAGKAKTALDGSIKTAGEKQTTLDTTVKAADKLDTSLKEQITTGTQLQKDLVASGEKSVQDIKDAGSEQLEKMQTVAEEFKDDREQINVNKEDIGNLKERLNKNYLDDAKTKRSLDALWKLNQGISYQFETDSTKAYQKEVPSGAKLANIKKIGGKTIVWNQLIPISKTNSGTSNGVLFTNNGDGSWTIDGTPSSNAASKSVYASYNIVKDHKYLLLGCGVSNASETIRIWFDSTKAFPLGARLYHRVITKALDNETLSSYMFQVFKNNTASAITWKPQLFDLTKMFGEGKEPATPEEFEALFPENYYEYNEGTLMSMPVNEVVEQGRNLLPDYFKTGEASGIISIRNGDGSLAISGTSTSNALRMIGRVLVEKGKKYKLTGAPVGGSSTTYLLWVESSLAFPQGNRLFDTGAGGEATALEDDTISVNIQVMNGVTVKDLTFRPMLTYANTEGDFSVYRKNTYPIPQAILNLDGYGDGVSDDVYNYVDWENKEYHKRVGKVDLGSLTYTNNGTTSDGSTQWKTKEKISKKDGSYVCMCPAFTERRASGTIVPITNGICDLRDDCSISLGYIGVTNAEDFAQAMFGVMLYYELAEEQIIDISDIIDNTFQEPIEVEVGGTLTFQNSNGDGYQLPIPNEEEYIVSLADIGGGASE